MTYIRMLSAVFILVFSFSSGEVWAQDSSDTQKLAVAKELAVALGFSGASKSMFDAELQKFLPAMIRDNPNNEQALSKLVTDVGNAVFRAHADEIDNNSAKILVNAFTFDELQQTLAFFQSPAGQKMINLWSIIVQRSMSSDDIMNAAIYQSLQMITNQLQQYGLTVPHEMRM